MFQKDPGHGPTWTWARTLGIPWTKGVQAWYGGSLRPGCSLPELFGIKYQFHIVDNSWQVFQRCPLQTKNREEDWASCILANVNTKLQSLWRTRGRSRRQHFPDEKLTVKHNRNRGGNKKPLIHKQWRFITWLSWHIIITTALAKANILRLLTECLISESWKLVAQLCLTFCDPHGLQPVRLLCPQNSPSKSTGVGCQWMPILR